MRDHGPVRNYSRHVECPWHWYSTHDTAAASVVVEVGLCGLAQGTLNDGIYSQRTVPLEVVSFLYKDKV